MTGAEFENQVHLQPLLLGGRAAQQNSTNVGIVNRISSCVIMLSDWTTSLALTVNFCDFAACASMTQTSFLLTTFMQALT